MRSHRSLNYSTRCSLIEAEQNRNTEVLVWRGVAIREAVAMAAADKRKPEQKRGEGRRGEGRQRSNPINWLQISLLPQSQRYLAIA